MNTEKPNAVHAKVLPRWVVLLFFWIGLTAAVCIRSLVFVSRYDAQLAIWLWRFAMVCYIFFFGYRYWIGCRRRRIIRKNRLIEKIEEADALDADTQDATLYILRSIIRSKELFNYALIFMLSFTALLIDLFFG